LQLKSLRLLQPASQPEQAAMIEWLSWQPCENLLPPARAPVPTVEPSQLDPVRHVNLDYVSKLPDFLADEVSPPQSGWLDELGRLKGCRSVGLDAARCAS
jgi:hypothetical protein